LEDNRYVEESAFLNTKLSIKSVEIPPNSLPRPRQTTAPALVYRPSDGTVSQSRKPAAAPSIMHRRSDASSTPLRPDGVFKEVNLSLLGWSDTRLEASLAYQITSNGGSVVDFTHQSQYACVCADGTRPTHETNSRLVSQRWVNECLAQGALVDPSSKVIFTPSMAQLPMLMMNNICLYITEKDESKFEEIAEIAKLCGIRFVSRNESRTPLSLVTHFIFHDLVSINRRRDLIPIAKRASKSIVSLDWLRDSYLNGVKQEESRYDLSSAVDVPALCASPSPNEVSDIRPLSGQQILICDSNSDGEALIRLGSESGAILASLDKHECQTDGSIVRIGFSLSCKCRTVDPKWLHECLSQKRKVSTEGFLISINDASLDKVMLQIDKVSEQVEWTNKRADRLVHDLGK
jgi:hypothetical protein